MQMTTQKQVRKAFWDAVRNGEFIAMDMNVTPKRIPNYSGNGKMHNTDTRCAFADFVDTLRRNCEISQELANRVTLK